MLKRITIYIVFLTICASSQAQDLNCTVEIRTDQIQMTDKSIFNRMKLSIAEFMNNRKWSNDKLKNNERIECNILITISKVVGVNKFTANAQIQAVRPIFSTNYNSPLLNFNDQNWQFEYGDFQSMDYVENSHISNLTSMLAYYAYIILGFDYDSFGLEGGTPYFQKAQAVVSTAMNSADPGWKPNESKSSRNRYWFVDNILDDRFKPLRKTYYQYHRQGLDIMANKVPEAREQIFLSLQNIEKVFKAAPNSIFLTSFFDAKVNELVKVYSEAYPPEKNKVVALLSRIDIANQKKYEKISSR